MREEKKQPQGKIVIARRPGYRPGAFNSEDRDALRGRSVYVNAKKYRIPSWAVAIAVIVVILAGLFFVVPRFADRVPKSRISQNTGTVSSGGQPHPENNADAVISVSAAPILASPVQRAARVAEALFNEPVKVLGTEGNAYLKVRLEDGTDGYIRRDHLIFGTDSSSPNGALLRVLVVDSFKRIMSHAHQGTLLVEAPMGSVFFADYRHGDLLRIMMPGGGEGWITTSGVLVADPEQELRAGDDPRTVFVSTLMSFYRYPVTAGGATARGISPEGAVFVAGRLNALSLPRTKEALMRIGEAVSIPKNGNASVLPQLKEGDLLFFGSDGDPDNVRTVGVLVADDQILLAVINKPTLRMIDRVSPDAEKMAKNLIAVRRLFS